MEFIVKSKSLLILSFLLIFGSCQSQEKGSNIQLLGAEEFKSSMEKENDDYYLIDVRTSDEYKQGNIEGSLNYDILNGTLQSKIESLDKNKAIYVYCAMGGRSNKAAQLLKKEGFSKIYDLRGGYNAWK